MNYFKENLPTKTSSRLGGGALENKRKKPEGLKKFTKYKKQKQILIGTIIILTLVIGGISLYKTFAIYEEHATFDVLKGTIPNFKNEYKENILHGADPVLDENNILVPVKIDDTGNVTKANTKEEWYNYEEKRWANTIIKQNSYDALNAYGKVNSATKEKGYVSLDGVDDYIDLGLENYDFGSTISLAIRLSFNSLSGTELLTNPENAGVELLLRQQKFAFSIYDKNENIYHYYATDITPELNTMYTIVGTYNGKEMKLYLNGDLVLNEKIETVIKPSSAQFCIGANDNPSIFNHVGFTNIDVYQAAIFDRALTEEEIKKGFTDEIKIYDGKDLLKYVDFTEREEEAGEVIPEDIIESYFVWIPKFKYKIFDKQLGKYTSSTNIEDKSKQAIEIEFGLTNTKDDEETNPDDKECATPMLANQVQGASESNGNCKEGMWMTHPAFLAFNTTGLWIGKFETSNRTITSRTDSNNHNNETEAFQIIIKPNVYSWRLISVANAYKTSLAYKTELQSHLMKNTEWGAVAYLTQSIYGKCSKTEDGAISCEEVYINNNYNYITGYASKEAPTSKSSNASEAVPKSDGTTTINYLNKNSVVASTTGNYTGIYDMSGGAWEYMASFMSNSDNSTLNYSSIGLNKEDLKEEKYYDVYNYNTSETNYSKRILGDATGEIGPFSTAATPSGSMYEDYGRAMKSDYLCLGRGGHYNYATGSGVFAFDRSRGTNHTDYGFRIILAVK